MVCLWLGSAQSVLQLRGYAWAWQGTFFNPPPLTLLLDVWLFFARFYTKQMYQLFCPPLDIPIVDTLLSSPIGIALLLQPKDKRGLIQYRVIEWNWEQKLEDGVQLLAPHLLRRNGPNCSCVTSPEKTAFCPPPVASNSKAHEFSSTSVLTYLIRVMSQLAYVFSS